MKLKTKIEKISDTRVKVSTTIDEKSVSDELTKQYRIYAKKYRFPGFRPGKAPRPVIDAAVGKETVYIDATESLLDRAYRRLVEDEDLRPVGNPNFENGDNLALVEDKKPFKIEFELEVSPEIELTSYDPIEGYLPPVEATEEDIDAQVDVYLGYFTQDDKKPELTDEFAKEKMGFESASDMREKISEMIKAEKERMVPSLKEDVVSLKLRERVSVEPTEEMVEFVNDTLMRDLYNYLNRMGTTFDQYLAGRNTTAEQFYEDAKKQARDEAKTRMALDAWAKHFKCECTEEDIAKQFESAGIKDIEKEKALWIEDGKLWKLREGVGRANAVRDAVKSGKWTFDEEKAKHQFDYLNEEEDANKSEEKPKAKAKTKAKTESKTKEKSEPKTKAKTEKK